MTNKTTNYPARIAALAAHKGHADKAARLATLAAMRQRQAAQDFPGPR